MPLWAWTLIALGVADAAGLIVFIFSVRGAQPFPYNPDLF